MGAENTSMKRLSILALLALTGCAPAETARLYWVVFMHDYGQAILFWATSWVK